MQLVIDISHNLFESLIKGYELSKLGESEMRKAIQHGTSLPEHSVVPKQKLCKDCKWWKDSDGIYRRGIEAESQCPINRKEVFEGNGYCFLFEPKKGESE